jgi:KUP system potassium uptake protein
MHNLAHNKVLHERVLLLTVVTADVPYVAPPQRTTLEPLGHGFVRVTLQYGFMEDPDVPATLAEAATPEFQFDIDQTTFFVGLETLLSTRREGMPRWRERLFAAMSRNALRATSFFRIPPARVVELGMQIEL